MTIEECILCSEPATKAYITADGSRIFYYCEEDLKHQRQKPYSLENSLVQMKAVFGK